ncbi:MAG: dual specificity protein phosphatase family protein [Anaerolineae bacterium]|nr:dual specificity protein phosphatase family protein [Anaerolineae bacterium]
MGRAPMQAAAYLILQGHSVDEALDLIRQRRPFISQAPSQRARLLQFEKMVRQQQHGR